MTNDQLGPHDFGSPGPHEEANQGQSTWKWVAILALVALGIAIAVAVIALTRLDASSGLGGGTASAPESPGPESAQPPAPTQSDRSFVMDRQGWQDSTARCDGTDRTLVTARTEYALIAICSTNSSLVYKGERILQGDSVEIGNLIVDGWGFRALDHGVEYRVTETELTISSGGSVLSEDPFIEYRGNDQSQPARTDFLPQPQSRSVVPPLPGASNEPKSSESPNGTGEQNGYGKYESWGEYATHWQCVVNHTPSQICLELVAKYGPEAEGVR
ncbi:hypothetical protein [Dietzia cinnamea]|uniref:hypothetical protein n=1 Tax=Dietzia cinnamea TaxID=321318 RepID=UPI00223BA53F|nr:hypothetical protein [Dietzia cinnamea]MCT2062213.1 hypothetical protein [Dietzia cinnamea]MCT2236607.1 hypothetical protein [Dietzia cinnamea]MCT2300097.1 hypothetical protein [Dietzia cinnamea]